MISIHLVSFFTDITDMFELKLHESSMLLHDAAVIDTSSAVHQCPQCFKTYVHQKNLARHIKFECGVLRQFNCTECQYKSKRKDHLTRHLLTVHGRIL